MSFGGSFDDKAARTEPVSSCSIRGPNQVNQFPLVLFAVQTKWSSSLTPVTTTCRHGERSFCLSVVFLLREHDPASFHEGTQAFSISGHTGVSSLDGSHEVFRGLAVMVNDPLGRGELQCVCE